MKKILLPVFALLLLLGSAPAWAFNPIAGVTVAPNTTVTLAATNNTADYYTYVDVQNHGRAIINTAEAIKDLTVRTGGILQLGVNALIQAPENPTTGGVNPPSSIVLEPGAFIELANTDGGLPFFNFVPATISIAPSVNYLFNGNGPQYTNDQPNGNPNVNIPPTVGSITLNNPGTLFISNNTSVNQELHLRRGLLALGVGVTLTMRSTAAGSAVFDPIPSAGNTSSLSTANAGSRFVVENYISPASFGGTGYRHIASPLVVGPTVASLSNTTNPVAPTVNNSYNTAAQPGLVTPFPTVFAYDETRVGQTGIAGPVGFGQGWASPASLSTALGHGHGYTVQLPGSATLALSGVPATVAVPRNNLTRGTDANAGYHLLGNPYAAPLNLDLLGTTANMPNMQRSIYVFRSSGQYAGSYSTYLGPATAGGLGIGANGGTNVLAQGQGFFVRTAAAGTPGSVAFAPAQAFTTFDAATPALVHRSTAAARALLRLSLHPAANAANTAAHETVVYFDAAATAGLDAAADAEYLAAPGQALALATETAGTAYSINGQPVLTGQDVLLPLRLTAAAGTYALIADELTHLPANYHAYLRDAATGRFTDLATTPTVTLTLSTATASAGRYALHFTTQARALATAPAALAALVSVYPNPAHGTATLLLPAALRANNNTPITVLNALGQTVRTATQPATAETLELPLTGLAAGIYTVRAATAGGTVSRRLVVE